MFSLRTRFSCACFSLLVVITASCCLVLYAHPAIARSPRKSVSEHFQAAKRAAAAPDDDCCGANGMLTVHRPRGRWVSELVRSPSARQARQRFGPLEAKHAKTLERDGKKIVAVPLVGKPHSFLVRPLNTVQSRVVRFETRRRRVVVSVFEPSGRRLAQVSLPGRVNGPDYDDYTNCVLFCASILKDDALKACIEGCAKIESSFTAQ